jgi:hypothetical protein
MDVVDLFNKVRDIPLRMPQKLGEEVLTCWGKHRKLFALLNQYGFKVRYRVCEFSWKEQKLPSEILKIPHKEIENHLYLEINLSDKWVILDCTMDFKMPKFNEWDGRSDCNLGVIPDKLFNPMESSFLEKQEPFKFEEIFKQDKEFFVALNKFYDSLREMNK